MRRRHSSVPVRASWAVMTQASGASGGPAAPPRDGLAAGDDRPRAVRRGVGAVVEDAGLPNQLAGQGVESEGEVVGARVDDEPVVDGEVAVGDGEPADVVVDVVGQVAPVLPHEVAGRGVEGLDDVAGVRHVEHAAVDERRALLAAGGQGPRPHHAQVADVRPVDLVEGAVAPGVEGPPPGQPVLRRGVLEHGVGHRGEVGDGGGQRRSRPRFGGGLRSRRRGCEGEPEHGQRRAQRPPRSPSQQRRRRVAPARLAGRGAPRRDEGPAAAAGMRIAARFTDPRASRCNDPRSVGGRTSTRFTGPPAPRRDEPAGDGAPAPARVIGSPVPRRDGPRESPPCRSSPRGRRTRTCRRRWRSWAARRSSRGCRSPGR